MVGPGRIALVLCMVGLMANRVGWCQVESPPAVPATPLPTAEQLKSSLEGVEKRTDISEEEKSSLRSVYQETADALQSLEANRAALADYRQRIESTPEDVERKRQERASLPETSPRIEAAPDATLADLEKALADAEQRRNEKEKLFRELDTEPARRTARIAEIPELRRLAVQRQDETKTALAAMPVEGESSSATAASRALRLVQLQGLQAQIDLLDAERQFLESSGELLQLRRDVAAAELQQAEDAARAYREIVNERRRQEAAATASDMEAQLQQVPAPLVSLVQTTAALAKQLEEVAGDILEVQEDLEKVRRRADEVQREFERTEKVSSGGFSDAVGQLLRNKRRSLPNPRKYERRIYERRELLNSIPVDIFRLQEQRSDLANLEQQVTTIANQLTILPGAALQDEVRKQLEKKREILDQLIKNKGTYQQTLLELNVADQTLIDTTRSYSNLIAQRVLWIRSAAPLGRPHVEPALTALTWLISPENWTGITKEGVSRGAPDGPLQALIKDILQSKLIWLGFLTALLPLIYCQPMCRREIRRWGQLAAKGSCAQFKPTIRVLLLTLGLSFVWPGVMVFLGWRLGSSVASFTASEFTRALASGLAIAGVIYGGFELLRQVCRREGLADLHFEWPTAVVQTVHYHLNWFIPCSLPLVFICATMDMQGIEILWSTSLGRVAFIGALLVDAALIQRLLRPRGGVVRQLFAYNQSSWLYRLRFVWYPLLILGVLALAGLAAYGYYETAELLALRFFLTGWLVLGLTLLGAMVSRWVLISRRRMTLEQIRQRRASSLAADETSDTSSAPAGPAVDASAGAVDLGAVSEQTRRMVRTTLVLAGLVISWFVWGDILPALGLKTVPAFLGMPELTWAQLVICVVALMITYVAAKDVPGVLEFTVLGRLPFDAGARYAVTSLVRYVIVILGIWIAVRSIGVTWDSIQWLVAALGIGLGFGLQEIVANFVCGIILLFERPIRIGDIITLGDTTGIVSRIRMRATTITDWDRKEYVVPNKDLITGRLLNWTLTDATNRIVINVGVAYGSDTQKARDLLRQVVAEHPLILDDPPPIVTFEGFGDSSLNLVLRCYLPRLDDRLATITELHEAIDGAFRNHGIEIPFPQRDLHLRSTVVPNHPLAGEEKSDSDQNGNARRAAQHKEPG